MQAVQIVMPSDGDMTLIRQDGGTILLRPVFYGGECAGPHIRLVEIADKDAVSDTAPINDVTVTSRYRLRIRDDGKVELKRGKLAEDGDKVE